MGFGKAILTVKAVLTRDSCSRRIQGSLSLRSELSLVCKCIYILLLLLKELFELNHQLKRDGYQVLQIAEHSTWDYFVGGLTECLTPTADSNWLD